MSTARDYLAAVQQRADAATDGPWSARDNVEGEPSVFTPDGLEHEMDYMLSGTRGRPQGRRDAEFIAASRTDVPRLAACALAVLDLAVGWAKHGNAQQKSQGKRVIAVITDALTPKETDHG